MTLEEVIDFFAPEQSTTDAVTKWLEESGISPSRFAISANKQVLTLPTIMWNILDVLVVTRNANILISVDSI
jgi:tripeptidyl-peptidase-1